MNGNYKINCSALSDLGKHRVGNGIVIRNEAGIVMPSCCQILAAAYTPLVAEIVAILRGILFSKDCGLLPCVLESDKSEAVVRSLSNNFLNTSYGSIISEIADLRSQFPGLNICAIPCSANRVARKLAYHVLNISKNTFWMEDFPLCIRGLVESEMSV
ncbi:hypothetical protein Q3G72_012368 [Acer saccharum]|nr:hypothetical protein Q3G72_012368 [Acer saccharum]